MTIVVDLTVNHQNKIIICLYIYCFDLLDTEELNQEPAESSGTSDLQGAGNQETTKTSDFENQTTTKTSDIGFSLGNETDEDKLRDTSEKG